MLLDQVDSIAQRAPDRLAVVAKGGRLTFGELAHEAEILAQFLSETGISDGALVAIYMQRTVDALIALIGVMKAGAAYTVVEDDGNHAEHMNRLASINASVVLCAHGMVASLRALGIPAISIDEARRPSTGVTLSKVTPEQVAYVLFTSGSTGKPKGVAVTHGNIAHYTSAIAERLGVEPGLRYAHVSTLAADLGNTSLFLSLSTGGCLHLIDASMRKDPAALHGYLIDNQIQFLKITPSHWNAIFSAASGQCDKALRLSFLVLGGESLPVSLARRILESGFVRTLANHYGPTETTVGVTAYPIAGVEQINALTSDAVPIGRALGSTILTVHCEDGVFRETNARGELYIGGPSVAAGYVGDPLATARSFVTIDSGGGPPGRFYKTGDHVSVDENGVALFLGRVDRQVKVNGYRVELEHIESVLRAVRGISEASVFFPEVKGKHRLVAAVTGPKPDEPLDWLKKRLDSLLPEYMIPKIFLPMDRFPRNENGKTDLKALRDQVLSRLAEASQRSPERSPNTAAESPLAQEVRNMWRRLLQVDSFGDDDDFFRLGGDSLDAIQLIAELQVKGHDVTAHSFLKSPTVSGLLRAMSGGARALQARSDKQAAGEGRFLSAAQDFFFRQKLMAPDHYNQAILLECGVKVDIDVMQRALGQLLSNHESLRTAYGQDDLGTYGRVVTAPEAAAVMDISFVAATTSDAALQDHIEKVSQRAQDSLSLAEGRLLKCHLFKLQSGPDHLLLVAHHVAVDMISWRILVSELVRLYSDYSAGTPSLAAPNRTTFRDWVAHIDDHKSTLYSSSAEWMKAAAATTQRTAPKYDASNTDGSAWTLWFGYSAEETRLLMRELGAALGAPFHVILLGTFAFCLAHRRGSRELGIDVESHGRVAFDETIDESRVIGWHTSTFPVRIKIDMQSVQRTLTSTASAMRDIPHLGVAYGMQRKDTAHEDQPATPSAPICFNYLGDIHFGHDHRFTVTPARYDIGRARGESNNRGHELKFTARIVDGQLIADLSLPGSWDLAEMTEVMRDVKRELIGLLGWKASSQHIVAEQGTRTGVITYVPPQLVTQTVAQHRPPYEALLLTGATGYLGVHVLHELLLRSKAHVYCLVRAKDGPSVLQRLHAAFDWYFPRTPLQGFAGRYTVIEGDIARERFGLPPDLYSHLAAELDAIYHFAADTRLFGSEEEFRRNNVVPVQTCIDLAMHLRPKDLHYMSTLAVSGINTSAEPVSFSEDTLDVGQEFQNHYESTKYLAERLVKSFEAAGGRGFIYRSGNVSGHSQTGRFQRNARENRLVQFLAACAKLGKVPLRLEDTIALSPIDQVAAGIVAISLDPHTQGGVFHVDSPYEVALEKVFDALRETGIEFEQSEHASFSSLFGAMQEHKDPELALGYFWASRKPRNVRYNHDKTQRLLWRLGCSFSELGDGWLSMFAKSLAQEGVFGAAAANEQPDLTLGRSPFDMRPMRRAS
ncbi:thioester reductase domain-containing protein [Polyangium aurulentum]|uniref:thioester reductase domain-containing protein n=1 Tax=Polyangium aurulentum TaxID=2567896 RepID=UPI0010AE3D9A|nr:thioester reductase domain-containing protein [Polyangium aurulentum]UQA60616.1 thioester reductase domain-containing protein [Polyangium aurulentum]